MCLFHVLHVLHSECTPVYLCQKNDIKFITEKNVLCVLKLNAILKLKEIHIQNIWED